MSDEQKKTTTAAIIACNKERGSFSQLWGRDCWVADSLVSLVLVHAETLFERSEDPATDEALKSIMEYCKELREKNRQEFWPDEIEDQSQ